MKARLALVPILLLAVSCSGGDPDAPVQEARTTVSPVATPTVVRVMTHEEACAQVHAALDRLEVPLQLLADGGTPVSWTDDYQDGAKTFHKVGAEGPGTVGSFSEGLAGDLDRLVTALNKQQTGAAKAIGDVVTNRIRNLKNACKHD